MADKNTIKSWFEENDMPNQAQFWAWIESYFHKDEKIPITAIDDIENILNEKADAEALTNHINDSNAHAGLFRPAATSFAFVQKGFGNTDIENEIGDIFSGWSNDGTIRYTEAIWLGGALNDSANFTPLVETVLVAVPLVPQLIINSVSIQNPATINYTNNSGTTAVLMVSSDNINFYDYLNLLGINVSNSLQIQDRFPYYKLALSNNPNVTSNVYEDPYYAIPAYPFRYEVFAVANGILRFDILALVDITIALDTYVAENEGAGDTNTTNHGPAVTYHTGQRFSLVNISNVGFGPQFGYALYMANTTQSVAFPTS